MEPVDLLVHGAALATLTDSGVPYGLIDDGALAVAKGRIVYAGAESDMPLSLAGTAEQVVRLNGGVILPAFVDCHTHLVFGGDRSREFAMRLSGATYEDIAKAGGGIRSTVRMTCAASAEQLLAESLPRMDALLAEGVGTIEIKSGYGLDLDTEAKQLRVARALGTMRGVRVSTTYLGLHALPEEYAGRSRAYVEHVAIDILPALHAEGLIDCVDAYLEKIAFAPDEVRRFFSAARALGLPVKLHADQLSDGGGARLAGQMKALSADHLEHAADTGIEAMARGGTVAVLLPGAYFSLRETKLPPIEKFRAASVPMAVATDCNPGTSPLYSMRLALAMACVQFRLTPEEAIRGATVNGARALGLAHEVGQLAPGLAADFAHWPVSHPDALCYWLGEIKPTMIVRGGQICS